MRRAERMVSQGEARRLLDNSSYGVLSLVSPDGQPYGVPVNHVYVPQDNAVYIHCAQEGQKLDFLRENPKASFTVVGSGQVIEEKFTTRYESAIVQGRASLVEEEAEKVRALELLCGRLTPSMAETQNAYIRASLSKVAVIRLEIREITGKRNRAGG